ncbi:MAG: AAA family ATPase [Bauldia sp.]|jgi:MoxR-like ATPase
MAVKPKKVADAETRSEELDTAALERLLDALRRTRDEIAKTVIGQREVVDQLLIALIAGGHVLLEGAPGVGKTLLVRTLGVAAGLSFARVQFTPDLMPADITGGMTLVPDETGRSKLQFQAGPIFTQILLADEINRATPKTQSALLEAMQERTVTAAGRTMELPRPFFVLATQNPVEMEGTYRLPEAQIDRFLFKSIVNYPGEEELDGILDLTTGVTQHIPQQVLTADDMLLLQRLVRQVPMAAHVRRTIARFALATQPGLAGAAPAVQKYFRFGLSPRGAQALVLAAKGHALLSGRYNVSFDDLRAVVAPTLRHRFQLNYEGEAEGIDANALIAWLLDTETKKAA